MYCGTGAGALKYCDTDAGALKYCGTDDVAHCRAPGVSGFDDPA